MSGVVFVVLSYELVYEYSRACVIYLQNLLLLLLISTSLSLKIHITMYIASTRYATSNIQFVVPSLKIDANVSLLYFLFIFLCLLSSSTLSTPYMSFTIHDVSHVPAYPASFDPPAVIAPLHLTRPIKMNIFVDPDNGSFQ